MSNTKRIIAVLLCVAMAITCFSACGKNNKSESSEISGGSSDINTSETLSGGEGSEDTSSDSNIIRPSGNNSSSNGNGADNINSENNQSVPENVKPIEIKSDVQEEKFKNLKGTKINIISDNSNPYEAQTIAEFKQRYDIDVEVTRLGWASFCSQLASMVASGNAPDVACMTDATFLSWGYGNLAQPLNKYLDMDSPTWNENDMKQFQIGNKYYGIPTYEYNGFMIYYNKTLLKERKIPDLYNDYYLKGEWTFAKMREVAKQLTIKNGDTVTTYGFATWYFPVFVLAAGGSILKPKGNTYVSDLNNKATIDGINMIGGLYKDGSMKHDMSGFTEFGKRGVAMVAERPLNLIGNFDYYNTMKDEIGVVPFPKVDKNSKEYAPALMTAYFVPNKAKNPMGGVAWMYYNIRRQIDGEANGEATILEQRRRIVSDEHKKIFDAYFSKTPKVTTKLEGLTGWGDTLRGQFWGDIFTESPSNSKSAEEAIAGMESIINAQLKITIGG